MRGLQGPSHLYFILGFKQTASECLIQSVSSMTTLTHHELTLHNDRWTVKHMIHFGHIQKDDLSHCLWHHWSVTGISTPKVWVSEWERERQWEGLILRQVMWEEPIKCILINWEGLIGASSNRSAKGVWAYRRLLGGDLPCSRVVLGGCRAVEEIAETLCCSTNSGASEWQHVRQPLHPPIAVCSSPWLPLHLFPHMERLVAWKTSWKNEKGKVTEAFRKDMAETETWLLFNCKWHIQEHFTHTHLTTRVMTAINAIALSTSIPPSKKCPTYTITEPFTVAVPRTMCLATLFDVKTRAAH